MIWNLTPLFKNPTPQAIKTELGRAKRASERFITKWQKRSDYLTKPAVLRQALDEYEAWQRDPGPDGRAGYYVWLRLAQDLTDPKLKALQNQIREASTTTLNRIRFFTLRLGKIPVAKQKEFLAAKILAPYRHFLERVFAGARHELSEAEEKILTLKAPLAHQNWVQLLEGFLAREKREGKTLAELASGLSQADRSRRQAAAAAIEDILTTHALTAEQELNAILQNKKIDDELRGFLRPDASRHLAEDMEPKVVDALIKTVANRFDLSRRYYELKAKLLGLTDFKYYDRGAALLGLDREYPLATGRKIVAQALAKLDPEFAEIFEGFFSQGLVDVYPRPGKRDGAFCAYDLPTLPTYLLLNYQNRLRDVTTLAHEVGHGINDELMKRVQPALYFGTPVATAEVASTFMEDFALEEIAAGLTDEERLSLLAGKLDEEMATIFRQVACYRFELELHQNFRQQGYLAKEAIGQLFKKHMASYLGTAAEGCEQWWIYWSHIRSFFYVYSYASGLLISKALQARVKKDPSFIAEVKTFLATGLSDSPKNIFSKLGLDITKPNFWKQGLKEVETLLDEVEALARRLGKLS